MIAQNPSASGIAHGVGMTPVLLVGVPPCHRQWYGSKPLTTMVHQESNLVLQLFISDPKSIVEVWYISTVPTTGSNGRCRTRLKLVQGTVF
jgi:hypothetical protein